MSGHNDAGGVVAALYQARAENDLDAVRELLHLRWSGASMRVRLTMPGSTVALMR